MALVRTFSKGYGLAGARVGYVVAERSITAALDAIRLPQNLSAVGLQAAWRALHDEAGLQARVQQIRQERYRLQSALEARGWQVAPSHANFLLARPPHAASALARWLQGAGLIVRSYAGTPRLADSLRLAVRAPDENARLLMRFDTFPAATG